MTAPYLDIDFDATLIRMRVDASLSHIFDAEQSITRCELFLSQGSNDAYGVRRPEIAAGNPVSVGSATSSFTVRAVPSSATENQRFIRIARLIRGHSSHSEFGSESQRGLTEEVPVGTDACESRPAECRIARVLSLTCPKSAGLHRETRMLRSSRNSS
jgi:hypothetical protein